MPALEPTSSHAGNAVDDELRFPPVTRDHILHCSYDYWFPKYRTSCIRSRIIPLTPDFVSYIREDGIILADEGTPKDNEDDTAASGDEDDWEPSFPTSDHPAPPRDELEEDYSSDSDTDTEDTRPVRSSPDRRFPALHAEITSAITALGGAVCPKLNWSSPKDATWISRHPNTMKCTSANDIYILLKSSSFISHDLDHAFEDTAPSSTNTTFPTRPSTPYFNPLPSLEFRCFVKDRALIAISQRDLNYYAFLSSIQGQIIRRARELFNKMRLTFPDACFVFDVYIPEADYDDNSDGEDDGHGGRERTVLGRARLIDINPWAPRTDTLLFDWRELLGTRVARPLLGSPSEEQGVTTDEETETEEEEEEEEPELRLVEESDPSAYNFSSPQYSAHKLPKDVVDASMAGEGGIREFARRWQRITEGR
ncbi:hypothetical protein N0V88_001670 [Collariella sp. IMI 366227]|nr:hypothetical protein N0V88_001670 [Collariella sp. IMI 366227]